MERLRLIARSGGSARDVALDAAYALDPVARDPGALLTACRRLVARRPGSGPLVWLSARTLIAPDPVEGLHQSAELLRTDPTGDHLKVALPTETSVVAAAGVLHPESDLHLDPLIEVSEDLVPATTALVVVEATAWGDTGWLTPTSSAILVRRAAALRIPIWVVIGRGVAMPTPMWSLAVADRNPDIWIRHGLDLVESVPVERSVGEAGLIAPDLVVGRSGCPIVTELFGGTV